MKTMSKFNKLNKLNRIGKYNKLEQYTMAIHNTGRSKLCNYIVHASNPDEAIYKGIHLHIKEFTDSENGKPTKLTDEFLDTIKNLTAESANKDMAPYGFAITKPIKIEGDVRNCRRMPIQDFVELGYWQEVNRLFFHPNNLALTIHDGYLSIVEDLDSPTPTRFRSENLTDEQFEDIKNKAEYVRSMMEKRAEIGMKALGYNVQPIEAFKKKKEEGENNET